MKQKICETQHKFLKHKKRFLSISTQTWIGLIICCFLRHVGFANLEQILKLLLKEPQIFRTEEKIEKEITNDIEPEPRGPSEPAENLKLAQNAAAYEQNQDNTSRE